LLQVISGYLSISEGSIKWSDNQKEFPFDEIFRHVTICAPVMNLYDEFTLLENVELFCKFRKLRNNLDAESFAKEIGLEKQKTKQLRYFSSGMRQRVKLGLAILGESKLLLLDEPTSHLDSKGVLWYQKLLSDHVEGRSLFVASNSHQDEIFLCTQTIDVQQYK
jgi:ABC-2 type transport system ATP-binding protein